MNKILSRTGYVITAVISVLLCFWYFMDKIQEQGSKLTDPITGVTGIENLWYLDWALNNVAWLIFIGLILGFAGVMSWTIYKDRRGRD